VRNFDRTPPHLPAITAEVAPDAPIPGCRGPSAVRWYLTPKTIRHSDCRRCQFLRRVPGGVPPTHAVETPASLPR
jgi:hypothetical protein